MTVVVLLVEMFNCIAMIGWSKMKYRLPDLTSHRIVLDVTGRGPIIANLHVTRERTWIFWSFFADDNNKWWQSRQQNPTFVSWL